MNEALLLARILLSYARSGLLAPTAFEGMGLLEAPPKDAKATPKKP